MDPTKPPAHDETSDEEDTDRQFGACSTLVTVSKYDSLNSNDGLKKVKKSLTLFEPRNFNDSSLVPTVRINDPGMNDEPRKKSAHFVSLERADSLKYPVHAAAQKGKVDTLRKLLLHSDPFVRDIHDRTPLHYASGFAYQKLAVEMVDIILSSHQSQNESNAPEADFINHQDMDGETALHIAARTGHTMVVERLLKSGADLNLKGKNNEEALHLIYTKVPTAMTPLFDGTVECKEGDPNDHNLTVTLDFGPIVGYPDPGSKDEGYFQLETKLLSYCLQHSEKTRSVVLLHPIVQTFLCLKWRKVQILLYMSILFHVMWLILYTSFICNLYLVHCPYKTPPKNETDTVFSKTICKIGHDVNEEIIEWAMLLLVSGFVVVKEIYEIYSTSRVKFYLKQLENIGQWLLILAVLLTSIPVFIIKSGNPIVIRAWQYQTAAVGVLLAWSLILSQMRKIPSFGIHIEIFSRVLRSFAVFVMIYFSSILVAFTVSFQILMPMKMEFEKFPWAFVKVVTMMIGEMNYDEMFFGEKTSEEIPFPASTKLLYAAFVGVVTIILYNLLIGLTVSDIQSLQEMAKVSSLSTRLKQLNLMEQFIISKRFQDLLLYFNKLHWLRVFLLTPQSKGFATNMTLDLHISEIPSHLQDVIREKAIPYVMQEDSDSEEDDNANRNGRPNSEGEMSEKSSLPSSFEEDGDNGTSVRKGRRINKDRELMEQMKLLEIKLKELSDKLNEHTPI